MFIFKLTGINNELIDPQKSQKYHRTPQIDRRRRHAWSFECPPKEVFRDGASPERARERHRRHVGGGPAAEELNEARVHRGGPRLSPKNNSTHQVQERSYMCCASSTCTMRMNSTHRTRKRDPAACVCVLVCVRVPTFVLAYTRRDARDERSAGS